MRKAAQHIRKPIGGGFEARRTQAEELAEIKNYTDHLKRHPDEARALLVRAGIYTKAGKLTKAYGG